MFEENGAIRKQHDFATKVLIAIRRHALERIFLLYLVRLFDVGEFLIEPELDHRLDGLAVNAI